MSMKMTLPDNSYGVRDFSPAFDSGIHPAARTRKGGPINWPVKSGTEVPHSIKDRARAFTLIEILVAMAIAMMVFVAVTTLLFSMGELWGRNSDARLFQLHARNVTRFLEGELARATLPPIGGPAGPMNATNPAASAAATGNRGGSNTNNTGGNAGNNNAATTDNTTPISVQDIRDSTGNDGQLITFQLPGGSRIITWPDRALPNIVCSLQLREGTGLLLLWHSYLETNFDTDAPRETLITPLVTALTYDYYDTDSKAWKNETTLRTDNNNQGIPPQRLHLIFTYRGQKIENVIVLPSTPIPQGLPML